MANLSRVFMKIFAANAGAVDGGLGVFGSLASGTPDFATDAADAQSLSNWSDGWDSAILGENAPCIEDMNAAFFVCTYILAYLQQKGIAEWSALETYYKGALVRNSGQTYISLQDTNTNHALPTGAGEAQLHATAWWKLAEGKTTRTVTTAETCLVTDDYVRLDTTGGPFFEALPPVASCVGARITFKWVAGPLRPTLEADGSELIDGNNTFPIDSIYDAITLFNNGVGWDIV